MQQRRRNRRHTAIAQGTYQGACLVHVSKQPASCNQQQNTTFISSHACSTGNDTGDTLLLHKAHTKARASYIPVHNRCNEIKNRSFFSIDACSRGHGTGDTLLLHKARTKAHASSMPVHNRCNEIKNRSFICNHTCSRGHSIEDTLQLHKACTKAHASSMPVHSWCYIINNQAQHCMLNIHHLSHMQQRPRHTRHAHGCELP